MKRIRQAHTTPELAVRRLLKKLGLSFRTCVRDLPGRPDIVNRKAGWAIFVHGCFWHGHHGCKLFTVPKTNTKFWTEKVAGNRKRDARKARALRKLGLRVVTVWQCEAESPSRLERRLRRVLETPSVEMRGDDKAYLCGTRPHLRRPCGEVRLVDLFSGCGGLSLGVEEAARGVGRTLSVRLAVEREQPIAGAYAANFQPALGAKSSDVASWFDQHVGAPLSLVERRTRKAVGVVDMLVGGPPCTGHSTLNNHTRGNDPRNALYLVMVRAAEVLRPRSVIVENVPAVERDSRKTLATAVRAFEELGYKVDHGVVCVADIGVPQLRKRHVLLAHDSTKPDLEAALNAAHVPARTIRWAIGDLRGVHGTTTLDTAAVLSHDNARRARYLLEKGLHDLPNRQRPRCQRDHHKYKSMYGRLWWNRPAQTITTGFGSPGQGRYLHPSELRTLTPHEAARLQFFPDWFDFSTLQHQRHVAHAIGNAVPPKLAFVLARHLLTLHAACEVDGSSHGGRVSMVASLR